MAQVDLLRSGKATRDDICAQLGIDRPELSRRFRWCGLIDELRGTKRTAAPDSAKFKAAAEADALYAPAVAHALAHPKKSADEVFRLHEGTTYMTLVRRIKRAQSHQN